MASVSLRLPDDVSQRLHNLVLLTGRSKTFYMVEAITAHIDDLEDLYLAEQSLLRVRAGTERVYTSAEVGALLGLED